MAPAPPTGREEPGRGKADKLATAANHIEDIAKTLDGKIEHEEQYGKASKESVERAKASSDRIRSILSDLNKEIPGHDQLRDEVRDTGSIKRPGGPPDS